MYRVAVKDATLSPVYNLKCFSLQVFVPGNTHTTLLEQLLPDTEYSVGVVAVYADGEGSAVEDNGRTC